jgi:hypothetical protein
MRKLEGEIVMTKSMADEMNKDGNGGYASVNGLNMYYEIHGTGQPLVLAALDGMEGVGTKAWIASPKVWRRFEIVTNYKEFFAG